MSDAQKERLLVNLRPHVVEVHLPDRVITVGPLGSATVTDGGPQVDELVRRGLVQLRDPAPDDEGDPGEDGSEDGDDADPGSAPDETPGGGTDDDSRAGDKPPARKARRARGTATAKRGEQ